MKKALAISASILALASPPAAAGEPLRIDPVAIQDVDLGLGKASFGLVVEVERLRGLPIRLRHLQYQLDVNKVTVTDTRADYGGIKLKKGQPVEIVIPVELNAAEALAVAAQGLASGNVRVQIRGEAGVRILLLPMTVPFKADLAKVGRRKAR